MPFHVDSSQFGTVHEKATSDLVTRSNPIRRGTGATGRDGTRSRWSQTERDEVTTRKTKLLCYYQRESREDVPMSVLLRPLTLGELLDRAFQIYRSRFALLVSIAAIAY